LLKAAVEEQRAASERAVADYVPTIRGQITDLSAPADGLLRQLPGVVQVETLVTAAKPSHRIVHLRDCHLVPRAHFAAEARHVHGRELTEAEVDALHEEHLLRVELVQLEQAAALRCLAKHRGVRQVLSEGLVEGESAFYKLKASELYAVGEVLARQLADVRGLVEGAERGGAQHAKVQAIEADVLGEVAKHRLDVLPLGARLRLYGAGQLDDVRPLDDAALLGEAKPAPGRPVDAAAQRARDDFQVKAALASGKASVVLLGGGHDLSDAVRRAGGGAVEYLRITTRQYVEADRAR
jgi:hypothetical protein